MPESSDRPKPESPAGAVTLPDGKQSVELWKQAIVTAGVVIVALIGAWQAIKINRERAAAPASAAAPSSLSTAPAIPAAGEASADSSFVSQYVYRPEEISPVEYVTEDASPRESDARMLSVERIVFGHDDGGPAFSVRLVLRNADSRPMTLALNRRFFVLEDDHGRAAQQTSFCCDAAGALLGAGQAREISLLFRAPRGWFAKDGAPRLLFLRAEGLLPLVRASWSFAPLRTAA